MTIVAMTGISGYLGTLLSAYLNQNSRFEKIIGLDIIESPDSSKLQFYLIDIPRNSKKIIRFLKIPYFHKRENWETIIFSYYRFVKGITDKFQEIWKEFK